jgi:hypothetical protein
MLMSAMIQFHRTLADVLANDGDKMLEAVERETKRQIAEQEQKLNELWASACGMLAKHLQELSVLLPHERPDTFQLVHGKPPSPYTVTIKPFGCVPIYRTIQWDYEKAQWTTNENQWRVPVGHRLVGKDITPHETKHFNSLAMAVATARREEPVYANAMYQREEQKVKAIEEAKAKAEAKKDKANSDAADVLSELKSAFEKLLGLNEIPF